MKLALAFLFCVAPFLVLATPEDNWEEWKLKHSKVYRSAEEPRRMAIWRQHMNEVKKHNEEYAQGLHTYTLGENQFCDLTWEEFSELYLGAKVPNTGREVNNAPVYEPTYRAVPDAVDLRQRGHVTPVKDQGSCGSCWAFASVVALEGAFYQTTGDLINLSEQQILGCANKGYGNQGCQGGWMNPCFQYVKDIGGIQSEKSLPYTGTDDKCLHDPSKFVRSITTNQVPYKSIPVKNYQAIREVVDSGVPVVIAVYVESTFQKYNGGIYTRVISPFEAIFNLNHAITVVGYDYTDAKNPYLIVKNSWSKKWGDDGYIYLKSEQDTAGLGQKASYPVVA